MLKFVKNIFKICMSKAKLEYHLMFFLSLQIGKTKDFLFKFKNINDFICKNIGNKFIVNHDYGLYEYTIFIYKTVR